LFAEVIINGQDLPAGFIVALSDLFGVQDLIALGQVNATRCQGVFSITEQVCRSWKAMFEEPTIWRKRYISRWPCLKEKLQSSWKEAYLSRASYTLHTGISLFNTVQQSLGKESQNFLPEKGPKLVDDLS